jgi:hypothetical protein
MTISIKTAGGALECRSPYNSIFVERARLLARLAEINANLEAT